MIQKYLERPNDLPYSEFIARIEAEGHRDHTQSVLRYRALQDAVNHCCDSETFRNVMDWYERRVRGQE